MFTKPNINFLLNKKLPYFDKIHIIKLTLIMYILHMYNNKTIM